jgi:hypothetical protein
LNRSAYSNEVSATATGSHDKVIHLQFDGNNLDSTINLNHGATFGGTAFSAAKVGSKSIVLNGTNAFVQLPPDLANQQEITIATWVYWKGGASSQSAQHIFDFGNSEAQYMFLSQSSSSGLRFAIKNGGTEQVLSTSALPTGAWSHIAVTLSASGATMYVNGIQAAQSAAITISPLDFKPILNYIGRSQSADPLFYGNIDDFRVYNYALSASEVALLAGVVTSIDEDCNCERGLSLWPVPANDVLSMSYTENNNRLSTLTMFNMEGRLVMSKDIKYTFGTKLNVSNLPSGIYMLKLTTGKETFMKKIIINH